MMNAESTSVDGPTCDDAPDRGDMATSQSAQASEMGSSSYQPPNWEDVKKKILAAIKGDKEPQVF